MLNKRIRFYLHLALEIIKRHWLTIALGFVLGILAFNYLPNFWQKQKLTLRIGIVGQYDSQNLPNSITCLISQGLTQIDENYNPQPGIATSWQIDEQQKKYTFKLRDNLFWHDGTKVQAKDIHYHFLDLNLTSQDEQTIEINLEEKFSPLLVLLSCPVFKEKFTGVGEYEVQKIRYRGLSIKNLLLKPKDSDKNKNKLELKFYPNEESIRSAFKVGEIDIIYGIQDQQDLVYFPNIKTESSISSNQYVAIFLNLNKDIFQEKSIRQALSYATPKPQGKSRAKGPISPSSWAYNDFVKTYDFDTAHAKELLKDSSDIKFKLFTFPELLELAKKIKENWQEIGVNAEINVVNFIPDDYDALLLTQTIPKDPDQYWFWHSSQEQNNISHLNNPRIDQLLEEGRTTFEQEKRREFYIDFQRFLLEESPAIFINHPTYYYIYRRGFENYSIPLYNR
ncbi:hypothetical protein COT63_00980 [Candidatus Shapirobacteria bacterium CG09_land_8_20_14_0_10_38_17]|uniref:Solute-binding protein family 5 domain-containing protein n=1 Tax=Candidatus Shapirobacteria bacterium CG09_land_8_20_14_0_10_38_17 TaxID=1974884 RepID=A0A2H0WRG2_9BACT|nr:MAG: hypothetical protein COT63_00980 [Candidatus Shapirobacteria bacterium CG09_land_8_20_14_0_10_38_17]